MRKNIPSTAQVRNWTITSPTLSESDPQPERFAPDAATEGELRHGYTLDAIERLARTAVYRYRAAKGSDVQDRLDAACFAIIEHLYSVEEPPEHYDLLHAALRASDAYVASEMHAAGQRSAYRGGGTMAAFERYWWGAAANVPSHENGIVERAALYQILPLLTPRQREAITLLAALGDYQAGADAMGITYRGFCTAVHGARRKFRAWWHEGETPSGMWRQDQRTGSRTAAPRTHCDAGHEYTPENTYWAPAKIGRRPHRYCVACRKDAQDRWYARKKASHGN